MTEPGAKYEVPRTIVPFDVDSAEYLGDGNSGVYFNIAEGPDGWYFTAVVDCEHFADKLAVDRGPFASEIKAYHEARVLALQWCDANDVEPGE